MEHIGGVVEKNQVSAANINLEVFGIQLAFEVDNITKRMEINNKGKRSK